MSIFDWFKKKQEEEEQEQVELESARKVLRETSFKGNERVDKLLEDIWADRERHPSDMAAVEPFLKTLRQNLKNLHGTGRNGKYAANHGVPEPGTAPGTCG